MLSEDFTEITEDGVFDKTRPTWIRLTVTSYSGRNLRVKKLPPDAVMLIFQVTVEGNYDGHNFHEARKRQPFAIQAEYLRAS